MKTDNELIAEFMGGKWETVWWGGVETKAFNFPKWHIADWPIVIHESTFAYSTSWDWLMPVVEKIQSLGFRTEMGYSTANELNGFCVYNAQVDIKETDKTKITVVYKVIVEFIKWHNSQK